MEIIKRLEDTYKKKWLPWKEGVDKAAKAAENQEIVAALRKKHPDYDSNPVLKYQKADLLKGAPDPRDYGGSDPINAVAALLQPISAISQLHEALRRASSQRSGCLSETFTGDSTL